MVRGSTSLTSPVLHKVQQPKLKYNRHYIFTISTKKSTFPLYTPPPSIPIMIIQLANKASSLWFLMISALKR